MFNQTQIPSLAAVLDKQLREADIDIVSGKVTDFKTGRFFANFTLLSRDVAHLTADELFLMYLKPAVKKIGDRIITYADGTPLYTRAIDLPTNEVVGWRCFQGGVPVNIYIARRPTPDRHQFIIDTLVQRAPDPDRYKEFEDEHEGAGGNDNPDTDTF